MMSMGSYEEILSSFLEESERLGKKIHDDYSTAKKRFKKIKT